MAELQRQSPTSKRAESSLLRFHQSPPAPCGACKFLRRKCTNSCVFAPHFTSDQGAAKFAAVHKIFGASNVSKLLLSIPFHRRSDAVVTISYEAQARLSDPVNGCVGTVVSLQQQVAALQAELALVQSQLVSNRRAVANAQCYGSYYAQSIGNEGFSANSSGSSNQVLDMPNFSSAFDVPDTSPFYPR